MDNGFDKACPSGNHMVDAFKDNGRDENYIEAGEVFIDKNKLHWIVESVEGDHVTLFPDIQDEVCYSKKELFNKMEKL